MRLKIVKIQYVALFIAGAGGKRRIIDTAKVETIIPLDTKSQDGKK
jgi:hypothetical protein